MHYISNPRGDVSAHYYSHTQLLPTYTYDAFGNQTEASGTDPFRYSGEYYDAESGFIYLRNRYYDPSIGRFITEDPYWNVDNMIYGDDNGKVPSISAIMQSCNLYVYCGNNPINRYDPSGNGWVTSALSAVWNAANGMQKSAQRAFWKAGADLYLRNQKGFLTSAWMLEYACQDNPSNQWRGDDSRIAGLMKEDSAFKDMLNIVINDNRSANSFSESSARNVAFEGGSDLYYSIHGCSMWFSGTKQGNDSWIINVHMTDTYDYTEITSLMGTGWTMGTSLGTIANDMAVVSQTLGALVKYDIVVDFQVRWP